MDTNVVIELLGGTLPESGSEWLQQIIDRDAHRLSVINEIELLGFNGSDSEMEIVGDFVSGTHVFLLTDAVVRQTINLRKAYRIKLPDAIIAATALAYDCVLVSRNTADFDRIDGLSLINPHLR